jgi:hypothetical protein
MECRLRRKLMKIRMTGAVGLLGAFVAGVMVATVVGGGIAAAGARKSENVRQGQQVIVEKIIAPTVTDEDIALARSANQENAGNWAEYVAFR